MLTFDVEIIEVRACDFEVPRPWCVRVVRTPDECGRLEGLEKFASDMDGAAILLVEELAGACGVNREDVALNEVARTPRRRRGRTRTNR